MYLERKRGQISIFIIIAIIIVVGVLAVFLLRDRISIGEIPARFKPIHQYFLSCIEENSEIGVEILGERGGYIYLPEFEPGSEYMPTSSQLSFLGQPVPYWYYVSGNNIVREQVPSKNQMESQMEKFLVERVTECDFSDYEQQGLFIGMENPKADVKIEDNKVKITLNTLFTISDGEETWQTKSLKTEINSRLGKFYDTARKIYDKEKQEMFLENYGVDILRLYMPVDGVDISCSPKVWVESNLLEELKQAITVNTERLRVERNKKKDYFVIEENVDENIGFLYSSNWPTKLEVEPSENGVLLAEPVGNQPGLGILGFCYVPYHFVYDLSYPVLIQVYDFNYLFQFPVSVIIDKNKAREALPATSVGEQEVQLCRYKNTKVTVYTYNSDLEPVEADISFKCFTEKCDIGKTEIHGGEAVLSDDFPQCINGFVLAEAEGYEDAYYMMSTNEQGFADIILDKLYEQELELKINDKESLEQAVIYFESDKQEKSKTVVWPQVKTVELSEGIYNITAFVYTDSSLKIPETKETKCVTVPKSGLLGIFGMAEEECFDIEFPEQTVQAGIIAGGKSEDYITETELKEGKLKINVERFPTPNTIEQLQDNYNLLEIKPVDLTFG